jgi:DNA-directed RNA polymerase subunit F
MNREADYTIKGFLYQFNVTLEQLLLSTDGSSITVEGIIEDVDIKTPIDTKAIQCKYHEAKENFTLSEISKPVLQMLVHYSQNKNTDIQYILYAHFPKEKLGEKALTKEEIEKILDTNNKKYISSYISKLKPTTDSEINSILEKQRKTSNDLSIIKNHYINNSSLTLNFNIDDFLESSKFKFIIGNSLDGVVNDTTKLLAEKTNLSNNDVEELFYPNAIQIIANKSIKHDLVDRVIDKESLIAELESTKKIAISRWTKELQTYKQLLKQRRTHLKINLQQNHRLRYFLFEENEIEDFENKIVNFITDSTFALNIFGRKKDINYL